MSLEMFMPSKRIKNFQKKLRSRDIDAVLLSYSRSTLYYAGTTQPSILIITPEDYYLVVIRGLDWVLKETWLDTDKISSGGGYGDIKKRLKTWKIEKGIIGVELDILPADKYLLLRGLLPEFRIIDVSKLILKERRIKDVKEIEYTRDACRIVHQGHQRILDVLKTGMSELELSSEIEAAIRKAGNEGLFFIRQPDFFMGPGPVASGRNLSKIAGKIFSISGVGLSTSVPMAASSKIIQDGEMIVVDIPSHCHGYHADQSRTYALGIPPEICKTMYSKMKQIADRLIEMMRPGIKCNHLYSEACNLAEQLGMGSHFMRLGEHREKVPFIGHGVGLEVNEPPLLSSNNKEILEEGMIVALELEMCGSVGEVVKLEDTLLITSDGGELLTVTSRDLVQI